ncbi:hypothetical protein ACFFTM_10435 [Pseudoduganella plicata]|uniref:DUF3108 domain-containing protein n=1 Tax=Pseudoduganella plicata TaxID=321984 RepID=A0A4P7BD55_9BURK|nr:hypothetical protein [Pseudoduganella plicata]QBQ36130.1 hypothetical protein E1742_08165 [Pseudoduganella plicata]GGY77860.1 hypothetical protein GCM10007388_08350 [Pseudoduganella plicata]
MSMRAGCWLAAVLLCGPAVAQDNVVLGDRWIYRTTVETFQPPRYKTNITTDRYVASYLNIVGKPVFYRYQVDPPSSDSGTPHGGTASDSCLFDIPVGKALPGGITCDEPLPTGKSWYARVDHESLEEWLTVTSHEEVKVGPRSWRATVIRSERTDLNDFDVGADGLGARKKTRTTYWYVPELKGMACIVREHLDSVGRVRFHESSELLEFTPAPAE